jgi:hypothetical protein
VTTTDWIAVASIVSAVAAIGAVLLGSLQAHRMREGWQAANAVEALRDLQSDGQRDARRHLYSLHARNVPYNEWSASDKLVTDSVCQQLNGAAYLSQKGLLPDSMLEEYWGNVIRNVYVAAGPRLDERRAAGDTKLWQPLVDAATELLTIRGPDEFYP